MEVGSVLRMRDTLSEKYKGMETQCVRLITKLVGDDSAGMESDR
jgi:hypothetical protein